MCGVLAQFCGGGILTAAVQRGEMHDAPERHIGGQTFYKRAPRLAALHINGCGNYRRFAARRFIDARQHDRLVARSHIRCQRFRHAGLVARDNPYARRFFHLGGALRHYDTLVRLACRTGL